MPTYCLGNAVYNCDYRTKLGTLAEACGTNHHCQSAVYEPPHCVVDPCLAGTKVCIDNVLKTCTDDGKVPVEGVDCGEMICSGFECVPKVCEPNRDFCRDGDVQRCDALGAKSAATRACTNGTACREVGGGGVTCQPVPCKPGSPACLANQSGICAADAMQLETVSQDCAAAGKVCDVAGTCSLSVVDELGSPAQTLAFDVGSLLLNTIDVYSSRHVTKLEARLKTDAPLDVQWQISALVDGQPQLLMTELAHADAGAERVSLSPVGVELEAGQRYEISVAPSSANASFFFDDQLPARLSFATLVRYPLNPRVYEMSITTELP
jgi:hypothetical protein